MLHQKCGVTSNSVTWRLGITRTDKINSLNFWTIKARRDCLLSLPKEPTPGSRPFLHPILSSFSLIFFRGLWPPTSARLPRLSFLDTVYAVQKWICTAITSLCVPVVSLSKSTMPSWIASLLLLTPPVTTVLLLPLCFTYLLMRILWLIFAFLPPFLPNPTSLSTFPCTILALLPLSPVRVFLSKWLNMPKPPRFENIRMPLLLSMLSLCLAHSKLSAKLCPRLVNSLVV